MSPPETTLGQNADQDYSRWFVEEVQPHEAALRTYLQGRFPGLRDVDDLIQETYTRLFRARVAGKISEPRPYLFVTARNAAVDQVRRNRIICIATVGEMSSLPVVDDRPDAAETVAHEQEIDLLRQAIVALPPRCGEILRLRRLEGWTRQQIGEKLGISVNTVDAQLCLGVFRCRHFLLRHGVSRERLEQARSNRQTVEKQGPS